MSSPNPHTVRDHATALAYLEHGQCKANRPLENNTRLILKANGDVAVRLHNTDVVTYHPDGTATLYTGGWTTVTTKDRINAYARGVSVYTTSQLTAERVDGERVGDHYGPDVWGVFASDGPRSDPRVSWCRKCRKRGRIPVTCYGPSRWRDEDTCEHGRTERHPNGDRECYRCSGTGQVDYGSRRLPVATLEDDDYVRVDADGRVVDGKPASVRNYYGMLTGNPDNVPGPWGGSPYGIGDDPAAFAAPIGTEQVYVGGYGSGYRTVNRWAKGHGPSSSSDDGYGAWSALDTPASGSSSSVSGTTVTRGLRDVLPDLETSVAPPCDCPGRRPLHNAVIHLNDSHSWSRERVADWLDTLDLDLRFPASA